MSTTDNTTVIGQTNWSPETRAEFEARRGERKPVRSSRSTNRTALDESENPSTNHEHQPKHQ